MNTNLLEMKDISKSFGNVQVLKNVEFKLNKNEIHALIGENGAGKSTLMKILNGVYTKSNGHVYLEGNEINPQNTIDAQELGISTVFQELNLIFHATVYENVMIGREYKKGIFIDKEANIKKADEIINGVMELGIDVKMPLNECSPAIQQMVSIARAIAIDCKILILDEPTSSLDKNEVKNFFKVIRKLKDNGLGIVYISHKMEEIFSLCDMITILRDGMYINTYKVDDVDNLQLVCDMIGKDASEIINYKKEYQDKSNNPTKVELKDVSSLNPTTDLNDISFKLKEGEILGLSGLLGSGRSEIVNVMYGLNAMQKGNLIVNDKTYRKYKSSLAIKDGFGLVPEERRESGIIPNMSVAQNLSMPILKSISRFGFINKAKEKQIVDEYIAKLNIKLSSPEQLIKNLSGGNQQKVIISRWLANESQIMLMDEPTRGIDIGAKREIEKIIEQLAHDKKSVLLISSEMEEMVRNCDRTLVMVGGEIVDELVGENINEKAMVEIIANSHKKVGAQNE